jgi:hypothetical protein
LLTGLYVLGWGAVAEAGLVSLVVVEHFDEFEQVGVCFGSGVEVDVSSDARDFDFVASKM